MPERLTAVPKRGPGEKAISHPSTDIVLTFLRDRLTDDPKSYPGLVHKLSNVGDVFTANLQHIQAPTSPHTRRFISRLPTALSTARQVHETLKADPKSPKVALVEVIDLTNHALSEIDEEKNPSFSSLQGRLRNTVIRRIRNAAETRAVQEIPHDGTVVESAIPVVEEKPIVDTEQRTEPGNILEALDKQLEEPSREEYQALLKKLESDASSGVLEDTDAVFVKFLPKALQYATKFANRKNVDWRTTTQLANYALWTYVEEKKQKDDSSNLREIQIYLNRALKIDLDNPFADQKTLHPLNFGDTPEHNREDEEDRNYVNALKKARVARRVKNEILEKGEISLHTQRVLDIWGVSEVSMSWGADRIIQEGEKAGTELTKRYQKKIRKEAKFLAGSSKTTFEEAYECASEAFMKLVYEYDDASGPFGGLVETQLQNRMVDIWRIENISETGPQRNKPNMETRAIFRFLEEKGLTPTTSNVEVAIRETGSSITPEEAISRRLAFIKSTSIDAFEESGKDIEMAIRAKVNQDTTLQDAAKNMGLEGEKIIGIVASINTLNSQERTVIEQYYANGIPLLKIGTDFLEGLSESRVSQIHSKALAKIRAAARWDQDLQAVLEDAFAAA